MDIILDPKYVGKLGITQEERFWSKVDIKSYEECWEWTGALGPHGYGRTSGNGKYDLVASRVSYELTKGQIPDGLIVIHSCDNPKCVNPSHLSVGTHLDNMQDMIKKGRDYHPIKYGEESPRAKLTDDIVRLIRSSSGIPDTEFARRFSVTKAAIRYVRIGLTWRHVK